MHNCPDDGYLFVDKYGNKLDHSIISSRFKKARDLAGIKRTDGSLFQPRIHDLRHTFAVNRLIAWYDSGMDVQRLLPILSTYLGHTQLAHTSVYLTMTDRLLNHANERFESFFYEDLENGLQER
jgi:integrase